MNREVNNLLKNTSVLSVIRFYSCSTFETRNAETRNALKYYPVTDGIVIIESFANMTMLLPHKLLPVLLFLMF